MKIKIILLLSLVLITSCARMGQPDGGWYDEQPPKVIGASPADKGVNVKSQKVVIRFDEFVKIDNATENQYSENPVHYVTPFFLLFLCVSLLLSIELLFFCSHSNKYLC